MKHPTASADLAGKTWRPIERDPDQLFVFETFDGDALAGNVRAVGNMAREMARLVRPDDAIVPTFSRDELSTFSRKLWTEPTVTECATTNRRPATLTIAGIDLPNPQPIDALLRDLTREANWLGGDDAWGNTDWHAGPKGFDGTVYATDIRAAIAEIQRQAAEIAELQGMLEEAIGPVRLVSELAAMTDTECEFSDLYGIREMSRSKLNGDFAMLRLYGDEDRKRAVADLLSLPEMRAGDTEEMSALLCVDTVAAALGLRRAS